MLQKFLEIAIDEQGNKLDSNPNTVLFEGGKIIDENGEEQILKPSKLSELPNREKYFKHQGKYIVIKLDFKDIATLKNPLDIANAIRSQLIEIAKYYKLNSTNIKLWDFNDLLAEIKLRDFNDLLAEINIKLLAKEAEIANITSMISTLSQKIMQGALREDRAALKDDRAALKDDRAALKDDRAALERQQAALERQQASLKDDRASLKDDRASLKDDRASLERQQASLKDDRASLERQQATLDKEFNKGIDAATLYIENMGKSLCEELHSKYKQAIYVLIDEYDAVINNNYDTENFEKITGLIRGIFTTLLKGNVHLQKGILTGILRVAKANLFSGLNNSREYGVLDPNFSKHYGFTEQEVEGLLQTKCLEPETLAQQMAEAKKWYNGYTIGTSIIYNPWSIAIYYNEERAEPYWIESGSDVLLKQAMSNTQIHRELMTLRDGRKLRTKIEQQVNFDDIWKQKNRAVFSLLIHSGYLTLSNNGTLGNHCDEYGNYNVRLPNIEVIQSFTKLHQEWVEAETDNLGNTTQILKAIHDSLNDGDLFKQQVQDLILNKLPHGEKSEAYFQTLIGGMVEVYSIANSDATTHRVLVEKSVAKGGRIDNIFYPKSGSSCIPVIIHEYKLLQKTTKNNVSNELNKALQQILEKKYLEEPLSKKEYHASLHQWNSIKLRSIVFAKDETISKWSMHVKEEALSIKDAKEILRIFKRNTDFSTIKQEYGANDAYDLVDKILHYPPAKKPRL
eukprot:Pgem_evm3s17506